MQSRIRVCHRIFRTFVAIKAQNSSVGNGEHLIAKISDLTSRNAALARSPVVHSLGALGVTVQWPIPIEAVAHPSGEVEDIFAVVSPQVFAVGCFEGNAA